MKEFLKRNYTKLTFGMFALLLTVMSTANYSFASESASTQAMTTAFGKIKDDFLAQVAVIAPIALAIVAAPMIWRLGIKFFKSLASK